MKWLFRVLWAVTLAIALAYFYPDDPGEVLMRISGIGTFRTTPLVFLLLLVSVLILLIIMFQLAGWTIRLPWKVKNSWQQNRALRADERLLTGWTWLSSGGYNEALKLAKQAYHTKPVKSEAALLAAHAEMKLDHFDLAWQWLDQVRDRKVRHQLMKKLMMARLYLQNHNQEKALETIDDIENVRGFNSVVGRLRIQAYAQDKQWTALIKTASKMKKKKWASETDYQLWLHKARLGEIDQMRLSHTDRSLNLQSWWKRLHNDEYKNDEVLLAYFALLRQHDQKDQIVGIIEQVIEKYMKDKQTPPAWLFKEYAENIAEPALSRAMQKCEGWLKNTQDNVALLCAMAHLSTRQELWGNAINYYIAALSFEEDSTIMLKLADLYDRTEQNEKSKALRDRLLLQIQTT